MTCDAVTCEREVLWCFRKRLWVKISTKEVSSLPLCLLNSAKVYEVCKKCLQFILKLQERLFLFSATANMKFSSQTKFAPKNMESLCEFFTSLSRMVKRDPTRWKKRSRMLKMQIPLILCCCLLTLTASATDTESTTKPKGDSTNYLLNVQTCAAGPLLLGRASAQNYTPTKTLFRPDCHKIYIQSGL